MYMYICVFKLKTNLAVSCHLFSFFHFLNCFPFLCYYFKTSAFESHIYYAALEKINIK